MRRKNWQIKTKYEIDFYELTNIQFLIHKFEADLFFKFLKNVKM